MAQNNNDSNSNPQVANQNMNNQSDTLDVRMFISIFFDHKYWFLLSVCLSMGLAILFLRYKTPVYSVASKVLIKDQDRKSSSSVLKNQFSEFGLTNGSNGFNNEIEIITTKTLNEGVVRKLKLYTTYYNKGSMKYVEVYGKTSPVLVDLVDQDLDALNTSIDVELEKDHGVLVAHVHTPSVSSPDGMFEISKTIKSLPTSISTPSGVLLISKNPLTMEMKDGANMKVSIISPAAATPRYTGSLSATQSSKTTTIAVLTILDNIPERGKDYLSTLIDEYNTDANIDNNLEARRTADFIEERLGELSKELNLTESEIEQYKSSSGIVDYQSDAIMNFTKNDEYDVKVRDANTQISLLSYIIEYVNDKKHYLDIIPANTMLSDQSLNQIIAKYNEIIIERNRLLRSAVETSPAVVEITLRAESYLTQVKTTLQSVMRQNQMIKNDLLSQRNKYSGRLSSSASKERVLGDINRQQVVKAELYTMLLQKREENLISLASAAYKAKTIEEPYFLGKVSPNSNMILLIALAIGLGLPYGIIFLLNFFSFRIEGKDDLAKLCDVPLFGLVPHVKALEKGNRTIVLQENKNSILMEVYRSLRSNLPFVMEKGKNVILLTSTTSGEGKTIIASNFAASIAFVGKKVLLVGLDIRKPRLAKLFNLDNSSRGISDFLARNDDDFSVLDNYIIPSGITDNLYVLPAGTIPPNPSELLERENLKTTMAYLSKQFDYVIIDSAPVGLVSDTFAVSSVVDLTLYVVRAHYSLKSDLAFINSLYMDKRLKNLNLVLNNVSVDSKAGYGYSKYGVARYSYGKYGYGYGKYGYGKYGYGNNGYGYSSYGYGVYGYGESKDGQKLDEV